VLNWLLKKIEKHQDIEKNKDWVMAQVELMDKEDYAEAYYKSQEGDEVDSSVEEEFLREEVARRVFSSIKNRLKQYAFVNVLATYKKLFHDFKPVNEPSDWEEIRMFTEKILRKKQLTWEDAAPYAYFQDQLLGATKNRSVRYLFIDEAQDYSMFQYAYIEFLFPYTRMTLLGDINQAIYSYASEENPLLAEYDQEKITLTKSYRSTKQIVEFTSCFAPGNEKIEPFHRDGDKPQLVKINNGQNIKEIIRYVKESRNKGYESIAIIGKTMQETKRLYNELKDELNTRLIHEETYSFQKGILLLPTSLAKGIEFDVVIIPDASNEAYGKERDQTIFYTACTRAMHQLIMLSEGEESRFIQEASRDKYERIGL
ncbi:MAG TPA: UvrD-helicase domain-containing protein, partial [Candidatus Avamphibacillus sp.]|nr:UvrD-helicase domain-containing protein [Candidatus Avamphibacillus sp.]